MGHAAPDTLGHRLHRMPWLGPTLWLAYIVAPVDAWGLFDGLPLRFVDTLALALLILAWSAGRQPRAIRWAAAAVAIKIVFGSLALVPRGFDAQYFANAEFREPAERSLHSPGLGLTRVDARLQFGADGSRDLPVHFFNDSSRFSYYLPGEPARDGLPVSVVWEGWLHVDRPGLRRLYLRASGPATLAIGDHLSATIPVSEETWVAYPALPRGMHRLRLALALPQGSPRVFEAGWTVDGAEVPFDRAQVLRRPVTRWHLIVDRIAGLVGVAMDVGLLLWLIGTGLRTCLAAWRRWGDARVVDGLLTIGWIAVLVEAFLFARPWLDRMVTLSGGDDWLTYETRARDIALNSIWMLGGAELGQGRPFFEMPLYPYFLAATHALWGDGLYGAVLVQRLLLGATVIVLWRLAATVSGERVGHAGLLASLVVVYTKVGPWSSTLLTELLFVPMVCLLALRLTRLAARGAATPWSALATGAIGGIATLTRSTLMLAWPAALLLAAWSLRPTRRVVRTLGLVGIGLLIVVSFATVRNWVVARQFVLINAYGSFNLRLANEPPASLVIPPDHKTLYDRLGLDDHLQAVIEYARQSPGVFVDAWTRRAAYALGHFEHVTPGAGWSTFYVVTWSLALAGLVLLAGRASGLPIRAPSIWIPLALALAHFGVLVLTFASVYGDRLLLPFYALLTPYVAVAVDAAQAVVWRLIKRWTAMVAGAALVGACVWLLEADSPEVRASVLGMAALAWGLAVFGVPRMPAPSAGISVGLGLALLTWSAIDGAADVEQAVRRDLLILLMALCARTLFAGVMPSPMRVRPWAEWGGVVLTAAAVAVAHWVGVSDPEAVLLGLALGGVIAAATHAGARPVAVRAAGLVCLALVVTGCASPPSGDVALADRLLVKASEAGAANLAADDLAAARAARAELDAELERQGRRWLPSYDLARDLAVAVQAAADAAAANATATRTRALREALDGLAPERLGVNLFANADFSEQLDGWSLHPDSDATPAVRGAAGDRAWTVDYRGGNWSVLSQSVPLKPDTVYVYEATLRSTAPVVALYWQAETGQFHEIDKVYPDWTPLRAVFVTPHWTGPNKTVAFHPVLMRGPGSASVRGLRLAEFRVR